MKKLFTLIVLTALSVNGNIAAAQDAADRVLPRIGIKGGLNLSSFFTRDIDDKNALIGFNAGIFVKMPVAKRLSIQSELYYTTKGAQVSYNNLFAKEEARYRLNYLELPLLVVFNLTKNLNVHAGPYISYLLTSDVSNESSTPVFDFKKNIDLHDYNRMDAGAAIGAAVDFRKLSIGARYNYGLTTVGKERNFGTTNTPYRFLDAKNSVLNVYVALSLN